MNVIKCVRLKENDSVHFPQCHFLSFLHWIYRYIEIRGVDIIWLDRTKKYILINTHIPMFDVWLFHWLTNSSGTKYLVSSELGNQQNLSCTPNIGICVFIDIAYTECTKIVIKRFYKMKFMTCNSIFIKFKKKICFLFK